MTNSTDVGRLLGAGAITAFVIRGGLFLLSFGAFEPGLGIDSLSNAFVALILDPAVALLLLAAAVVGVCLADRLDQRRGALYAYVLGWVFILDCAVYSATIAAFYLTSGETDAPAWFAGVPAATQIPLVVLSIVIIRATAWAATRRGAGPSRSASRSGRSTPDPGGSPA